jgi:hypothetical protein
MDLDLKCGQPREGNRWADEEERFNWPKKNDDPAKKAVIGIAGSDRTELGPPEVLSGYEEHRKSRSTAARPAKRLKQHDPICRVSATVPESSFAKEKESNHVEKTRNVLCSRSYSFERVLVVHRRCRRAVSRRPEVPWHSFRRRQLDLRLPSIAGLAIMLQTRRGPPRLLASPIYSSDKALPDMRAASYFPREVAAAVHRSGRAHLKTLMERIHGAAASRLQDGTHDSG